MLEYEGERFEVNKVVGWCTSGVGRNKVHLLKQAIVFKYIFIVSLLYLSFTFIGNL